MTTKTEFLAALIGLLLAGCAVRPPAAPPVAALAESREWVSVINEVSPAIVTIRVDATRPFDTEGNFSSQATGFVVDAERGLILTNRHVVQPGPVTAEAIFLNKEEVKLTPVYYDPVHDFGFYRYDPAELRYLEVQALPLLPEHATVGREIRVIGNDAGEQLSILAGTLARLDRAAPDYGRGNYNDFNTFYIQAASGTSGGSSGSPVVDAHGHVVALNAGARLDASSSYFLPLDRVQRAMELLQADRPVPRGTLQTTFVHEPFDELRRLGLRPETESRVRAAFPRQTGMLVVEHIVPGGPADGGLQPGDVLVRINGELVTQFVPLESVLDGSVGGEVQLQVERGGTPVTVSLPVGDLHAITPSSFIETSGAVLHDLSYQMARHLNMPVRGVFVASAGHMLAVAGVARGAVVTGLDGRPVASLADLRAILATLPEGARVALRYFTFDQPRREQLAIIHIDRKWFPTRFCTRNDRAGIWDCAALAAPAGEAPLAPAEVAIPTFDDPRADRLAHSLVFVNFDMPYPIDGVEQPHYYGTGLIVDAQRGLVVVDRNTVPVALGDARLTFASSLEIPARVVYVHPLHNLAMLQYDPALLGDTPIRAAELRPAPLDSGDPVWLVGFQADQTMAVRQATIGGREPVQLPLSSTFRFRDSNLDVFSLVNPPEGIDGVLTDAQGRVVALWSSFAYQAGRGTGQTSRGMPAEQVRDMLAIVRDPGRKLRSLEAELYRMPLASARKLGLPEDWAGRLGVLAPRERRVLAVERLVAGSPAEAVLQSGDLLLAVDGRPVVDFRAVELATQQPAVELTIFRQGEVRRLQVETVALDGRNTDRILVWGGAILQEPHRAVAAQRGIPREGVFVAYFAYGSPASHYGLYPGRRIIAVDGQRTPDLDAFRAAVAGKRDGDPVRLMTVNWDGRTEIITLKLDLRYFPTYELRLEPDGWRRIGPE